MADEEHSGDVVESQDVDPGEPIAVLSELRQAPPRGFLGGIRGRIQRRHLAADTADFSLTGLAFVALAFVTALFQALQPSRRTEGDE